MDEPSFVRMCKGKEVEVKEIRHRLPCALVSGTRMRIFETARKAAAVGQDVLKCVDLPVDTYLNRPRLDMQDRWTFSEYQAKEYEKKKSYNLRKMPHPVQKLENRLLLFAETQIGKTGAFIHFLLECVQETRHTVLTQEGSSHDATHLPVLYCQAIGAAEPPPPKVILPKDISSSWHYPYWGNLCQEWQHVTQGVPVDQASMYRVERHFAHICPAGRTTRLHEP